jgi:hypothetical protein
LGSQAAYFASDRSSTGYTVFYRDAGIDRLYDSTFGDVITFGASGVVSMPGGLLLSTLSISGNLTVGTADNAYMTVDASGNSRLGFTKKSGSVPKATHGSTTDYCIARSSTGSIVASSTYTDELCVTASLIDVKELMSATLSSANSLITATNSGAGPGLGGVATSGQGVYGSATTGQGVYGTSSLGTGVVGNGPTGYGVMGTGGTGGAGVYGDGTGSNHGILGTHTSLDGVYGSATTGQGVQGFASSSGYGGYFTSGSGAGIYASSTSGLAGHFGTGSVQIDGNASIGGNLIIVGTCTGCTPQPLDTTDFPTFAALATTGAMNVGTNFAASGIVSGGSFRLGGGTLIDGSGNGFFNDVSVGGTLTAGTFTFAGHSCSLVATVMTCP